MAQGMNGRLASGLAATCVCAVVGLAFVASAGAATYKGPTTQGKTMKLTVNRAGIPVAADYTWDMKCTGGSSLTDGATVSSRFPRSDAEGFRSSGTYTADVERKFEAEVRVRIEGDRASDTRFTGRFRLRAKVFTESSGELLARCSTGIIRWTANLKGPAQAPEPPVAPRFHRG